MSSRTFIPITSPEDARAQLKKWFRHNTEVYTRVEHVSRSGMSRIISVYIFRKNQPLNITSYVASVLGEKVNREHFGIRMDGCGMDMGFELVYRLSDKLYRRGKKYNHDAAYRLNQRWIG